MSQQYNKVQKRKRRVSRLKRKAVAHKKGKGKAKTAKTTKSK